ncbi:MAG: NUDIX domain-containing protein [Candidatus Woesearchaeota archaeon]
MIEKSAGFIIYKKEKGIIKFLLLKRADKKDYWEFPKGHIEHFEDDLVSAKRELFEETGIRNLKIIEGFKEQASYISSKTGNTRVFTFFLATSDDKIKISPEHTQYKFLSPYEAKKCLTMRNGKV